VLGCSAAPAAITQTEAATPLPAVPESGRLTVGPTRPGVGHSPPPGAVDADANSDRKSSRGLIAASIAVVLAGAAVAVALVVTGHHGSRAPTKVAVTTEKSPGTKPGTKARSKTVPTQVVSKDAARRGVIDVLESYESDYSNHDVNGLRSLFTTAVTRYGDRAGGCGYVTGRSAVLSAYAAQFAIGTGRYSFLGLSPSVIDVSGEQASTTLAFTIAVGSQTKTGQVSFGFSDLTGSWLIRHIHASC
jgi:hypothetical protein